MIKFEHKGDFSKVTKFLERAKKGARVTVLDKYAQEGVNALMSATPVETGKTAGSWYYEIEKGRSITKINFCNSNVNKGVNIAIILQTGHGTGTGGWVEGRDYINPAIQPVFDRIADTAWKEVVGNE